MGIFHVCKSYAVSSMCRIVMTVYIATCTTIRMDPNLTASCSSRKIHHQLRNKQNLKHAQTHTYKKHRHRSSVTACHLTLVQTENATTRQDCLSKIYEDYYCQDLKTYL